MVELSWFTLITMKPIVVCVGKTVIRLTIVIFIMWGWVKYTESLTFWMYLFCSACFLTVLIEETYYNVWKDIELYRTEMRRQRIAITHHIAADPTIHVGIYEQVWSQPPIHSSQAEIRVTDGIRSPNQTVVDFDV